MNADDRIRLQHMLDAARAALSFAEGREREDLETDQQLAFALVKAVEIIGEAAARVSPDGQAGRPEIPWAQIVGMRNVLVHAYFDIDYDQLWETVRRDLLPLVKQLERIVLSRPDSDTSES
jgi:uncharacterized protein with HEPN domain